MRSLSPFGERVGVRGLQSQRETLTPHPTPLPMGKWIDIQRQKIFVVLQLLMPTSPPSSCGRLHVGSIICAPGQAHPASLSVGCGGLLPPLFADLRKLASYFWGFMNHGLSQALPTRLSKLALHEWIPSWQLWSDAQPCRPVCGHFRCRHCRFQRMDQPCQLIFLCLYSQYVTSAWAQMVGPLSQHGRNKIFKIRPR